MANLEKHKKKLAVEWLEAEESTVPSNSRNPHVLGSYIKIGKPAPKKPKGSLTNISTPANNGSDRMREPGAPQKPTVKHSQAGAWDHLKKLDRLGKLRAPYQYKSR